MFENIEIQKYVTSGSLSSLRFPLLFYLEVALLIEGIVFKHGITFFILNILNLTLFEVNKRKIERHCRNC